MQVKTFRDWEEVPAGTLLQNVEDIGYDYRGLWCSMFGSYWIEVPKKICKVIDEAS